MFTTSRKYPQSKILNGTVFIICLNVSGHDNVKGFNTCSVKVQIKYKRSLLGNSFDKFAWF